MVFWIIIFPFRSQMTRRLSFLCRINPSAEEGTPASERSEKMVSAAVELPISQLLEIKNARLRMCKRSHVSSLPRQKVVAQWDPCRVPKKSTCRGALLQSVLPRADASYLTQMSLNMCMFGEIGCLVFCSATWSALHYDCELVRFYWALTLV